MQKNITYEQPLNERIRSFLRLEHLFREADFFIRGPSIWNSRATMSSLIEIQSLVGRSDLKTEVLKELERNTANLAKLEQNPQVDRERLNMILDDLDILIDQLYSDSQQIGHELKSNEFLNTIRQRISVPGGTCDFDLPGYHFWLQQPEEQRMHDLGYWLSSFNILRNAIGIVLKLSRESAIPRKAFAESGFYQQSLDSNQPCQMLRITLPTSADFFPEVSGGKHRFTVRFLRHDDHEQRPKQIEEDVEFEIACCLI